MRLRLVLDKVVLFDFSFLEPDEDSEPEADDPSTPADVHDLSSGHEIGESKPVGFHADIGVAAVDPED